MNKQNNTFERTLTWYENKNGLIFAIFLSATLKIILMLFNKTFSHDGTLYINAAQNFASGNFTDGLALYPMPLFSLIITFVHFFVPDWEIAGKLISLTSIVLATIPLYLLTADIFNRKAAFWASITFAVSPLPNEWAVDVIRDPVFVLLVLWSVYFAENAFRSKRPVFFLLTAFFSCISNLIRIEGIVLIPFFFFFTTGLIVLKKKERASLIKGILIFTTFCVFFAGIFFLVTKMGGKPFSRIIEVTEKTEGIFKLNFLDNYHRIYTQLKDMEKVSLQHHQTENFAETAKKFIPIIYLLSLLNAFVMVMFPLYIIPMIWACKYPSEQGQAYIFALVLCYLLLIYYVLIEKDLMQLRFLFAPVSLAYIQVGLGMEKMINRLKSSSMPQICFSVIIVIFIVLPISKSVYEIAKSDNILRETGKWLAANEKFYGAKLLVNDNRAAFFAERKMGDYLYFEKDKYDFSAMEKYALQNQVDILIIKVPVKEKALLNNFSYYTRLKEFTGKDKNAYVLCSSSFYRGLPNK